MKKLFPGLFALLLVCGLLIGNVQRAEAQPGMRMGRVRVYLEANSTVNSAKVYLNNKYKGTVYKNRPLLTVVPFGGRVTVKVMGGGLTAQKVVTARGGRITAVRFTLRRRARRGRLQIKHSNNSRAAWARLILNGKDMGRINRGQTRTFRIRPGTHKVRIRRGRRSDTKRVRVRRRRTSRVILRLRARRGILIVTHAERSDRRWANLYLNGKDMGKINRGQTRKFRLRPGQYKVSLRRRRLRHTRTVRLGRGDTDKVVLRLRRRRGTLIVTHSKRSGRRWANLYINGKDMGRINRGQTRKFRLRPNRYKVSLRRRRLRHTRTVRLGRGDTDRVVLRLRRRNGTLRIVFSRGSRYAWAILYINGSSKGRITRGQTRTFKVRRGSYRVEVKRGSRAMRRVVRVEGGGTATAPMRL